MVNKYKYVLVLTWMIFISCHSDDRSDQMLLAWVDPMIGTGFHGHTYPGPTTPHGRIQLSPDTHIMGWDASSGYHYEDSTLYGFSHTHLSGTGIGDLGEILFLPFTGSDNIKPVGVIDHKKEAAQVGYYSLNVAPWNIKAELTATEWAGVHKYTYPENSNAKMMIDLSHILQPNWGHRLVDCDIEVLDSFTIRGYQLTTGWAAHDPVWFYCQFDQPIESSKILKVDSSGGLICYLDFGRLNNPLNSKVSLSHVDQKGAKTNFTISKNNFNQTVEQSKQEWNEKLQTIQIKTSDENVMKNFYTALYHSYMAPQKFQDADGRYRGLDKKIHSADRPSYTVYSLWDVFRAWYPLMTIIEPEDSKNWVYDLTRKAAEGGLLPKWALRGNYTGTMVGYPAVSLIADAITKNLIDSSPDSMLEASLKASQWQPNFYREHQGSRAANVMNKAIYFKEKYGIVPEDSTNGSVSYGLEMAYYDWCIQQIALSLERQSIVDDYYQKSSYYKKYFNPDTKFMQGVDQNGNFDSNFNPNYSDHEHSPFIEGNSWQWTPMVMHDPEGLQKLIGGPTAFGDWLDELFSTDAKVEGENASGDITGLIGQYAHGNEPSHHVPFLYQYTDRPWRTQEILDTILYHFYKPTPAGIIGNEDCGQMSAWYVLNAIGLYQMTPGRPVYQIGRPIVDAAKITVPGGYFDITVRNNSKLNKYIKNIRLNGYAIEDNQITYSDIVKGGELVITMKADYH